MSMFRKEISMKSKYKLGVCFGIVICMICVMNNLAFAWDSGEHGGKFDQNNPWPSQSATDRFSSHPGITDPHEAASYTVFGISSSIVFSNDGNQYYFYVNNNLYCVNTAGVFQWSVPCGDIRGGAPIVADDGTVYALGYSGVIGFNSNGTIVFSSDEYGDFEGAGDNYLTLDYYGGLLFTQVRTQVADNAYAYEVVYRFLSMSTAYVNNPIKLSSSSLPPYDDLESESSVAVDHEGFVYVFVHGNLCVFDKDLNQIQSFSNDPFYLPNGYDITIGPENTIFVATYAEPDDPSFAKPYGSLVKIKFSEDRKTILETVEIKDNGDPYSNTPYVNCKVAVDNEGNAYAVTGRVVYEGYNYVGEETGRLLKIDASNNVTVLYTAPEDESMYDSPTITSDGMIYLCNGIVLDAEGNVLWSKPSSYSQAIDNNGYVYFVTSSSVTSYKQRDPGYPFVPAASATVSEVDPIDGDVGFNMQISRAGGSEGSFTIEYKTADDTAIAGVDYIETKGTLAFHDGENSKYVWVPYNSDRIHTGDRQFSFLIENPNGCEALPASASTSATLIILEDDEIDNTDPYVVHSNPAGGETDYRNDGNMLIEFDDYIIEGSNFSEFILTDGTNNIPLKCTLNEKSITVKFSQPLLDSRTYTLSIREDAINDESGNKLSGGWSVSFSTPSIAFAGGDGSVQTPYLINSASSLDAVRYYSDKCFRLSSDIDMGSATGTGGDYYYEGKGFIPIPFSGIFDGNGKTISNMNMDRMDDQTYIGLFGINYGTITNLTVENHHISYENTKNKSVAIGAIAGQNEGIIFNCVNKSTVTFKQSGSIASPNNYYLGGITGKNSGTIEKCANLGSVNAIGGFSSSRSSIGGLAGHNNQGVIRTSYNDVSISMPPLEPNNYVILGGIAGSSDGTIEDCYNTKAIGSGYGILGNDVSEWYAPTNTARSYSINNEFSIGVMGGKYAHAYNLYQFGGTAIARFIYDFYSAPVISGCVVYNSMEDAKRAASFPAFDFTDVWSINEGVAYPTLERPIISPTEILVEQTDLNLATNQSFALNPTILPGNATLKRIKYISSDPNVASVDPNGIVRGANPGTATIIVFALDGMQYTEITAHVAGLEVSFFTGEGTPIESIDAAYNATIDKPEDPLKVGNTLANWYKELELTTLWNFDIDTVTGETTLYAKWTPNVYHIAFDANLDGGSETSSNVPMANHSFTYDVSQNLSNNTWTRSDYNFAGWNTAPDGSGINYLDGESILNLSSLNNADITLYAQWEKKTHVTTRPKVIVVKETTETVETTIETTIDENGRLVTVVIVGNGDEASVITVKMNTVEEESHRYIVKATFADGGEKIIKDVFVGNGEISFAGEKGATYVIEYVDRSFADCEDHWAKKAIEALAARGIIEGTAESTFEPNETITRADVVTLLSRYFSLMGDSVKSFADVEEDRYYSMPIAMFKAMDVLPPLEGGLFKPNEPIIRQDLMYILNMVLMRTNTDMEDKGFSVAGFNDFEQASEYAVESIKYLVSRDVIHGHDNFIDPTGTATRAEIAQVLFNMIELLRK